MQFNIKDILQSLAIDLKEYISEELHLLGIPIIPKLRLNIIQLNQNDRLILDTEDVYRLFSFFGDVVSVSVNMCEAVIEYREIVYAYIAQKLLNEKHIENQNIRLKVN